MTTEILSIHNWTDLLKLAENGDPEAQYEAGLYLENGHILNNVEIVKKDILKSLAWYLKSHERGNIEATIRYADFLSEGLYCEKDIDYAIKLYWKGIDAGSGIAANNLATIYRDKNDLHTAFQLYQKAQELDNANTIQIAYCYYYGLGTSKDKKKAFDVLLKISNDHSSTKNCEYEINDADYYIGKLYLEGEIVEKSIETARMYLLKANKDNDHRNANELLLMIGRNKSDE